MTVFCHVFCTFFCFLGVLHGLNHKRILILLFIALKLTYYCYFSRFAEVVSLNHFQFSAYINTLTAVTNIVWTL